MLQLLKVNNLALVESTEIEFQPGFNAITGETGAGKSVLLGALALLAGARADKTIIRAGAKVAAVEGILHCENTSIIDAFLASAGLPTSEEESIVIRRVIAQEASRSRITINGALATLANLRSLSPLWIDFHGPSEPQKLFQEKYQLRQLDHYAQLGSAYNEYRKGFLQRTKLIEKKALLMNSEKLSDDEITFYHSQIENIDQLNPTVESIEALERDYSHFTHRQTLIEASATLTEQLSQGENAITSQLQQLFAPAQQIAEIAPDAEVLVKRIEATIIEIEDIASTYNHFQSSHDLDEEDASALQQRMDLWLELKRKHGDSVQGIIDQRKRLADKIASQSNIEGQLEKLQRELDDLEKMLRQQAFKLGEKRQLAAKQLAQACQKELNTLGFKKAHLTIEIIAEKTLMEWGDCRCAFQFAPNIGQPLMPLNKIASSGETARVMLALKTVLAQYDSTAVLVFDEIDANVGGEIGNNVGKALQDLSKGRQIFCVTHLPQVAAQASQHYHVEKTQHQNNTQVIIKPIHPSRNERVKELARMLGDRNSVTALTHAEELLT